MIVYALFDTVYDQSSAIIDVIAVATIVGAATAYSRMKSALEAALSATASWKDEAEANRLHINRLEEQMTRVERDLTEAKNKVTVLESRPDLTGLEALLREHERNAEDRAGRMIAAIQGR